MMADWLGHWTKYLVSFVPYSGWPAEGLDPVLKQTTCHWDTIVHIPHSLHYLGFMQTTTCPWPINLYLLF